MSAVVTTTRPQPQPQLSGNAGDRTSEITCVRRRKASSAPQEIDHVRLVVDEDDDEIDLTIIQREFPTVIVEVSDRSEPGDLVIDDFAWRGAFDFRRFDEAVEQGRPVGAIAVRGTDAVGVATEVLARYQRLVARRNRVSTTPLFEAVLEAHASLFDVNLPFVRADLEHARDTWQWMLRLEPTVGLAPQLAALFHDIDRLESEPHERIEHRAHRVLDDPQAKRGGERALAILRGVGVDEKDALRARDLIGGHIQDEPDAVLLDDADSLSFLSLMSPSYADYFGLAQTRRKVSFTLGRLAEAARAKVAFFRLRPDVDRLIQPG
ncbi:MAG: hypothetical protein K0S65_2846 [Labilithrix sp.]|nr:hypothetical protein [Labilithrix sp.]